MAVAAELVASSPDLELAALVMLAAALAVAAELMGGELAGVDQVVGASNVQTSSRQNVYGEWCGAGSAADCTS